MNRNDNFSISLVSDGNDVFSSLLNIASSHCDFYVSEHDEFSENALITTIVAPYVSTHNDKSAIFEYVFKGVVGEKSDDENPEDIHHQHFKVTLMVSVTEETCPDLQ